MLNIILRSLRQLPCLLFSNRHSYNYAIRVCIHTFHIFGYSIAGSFPYETCSNMQKTSTENVTYEAIKLNFCKFIFGIETTSCSLIAVEVIRDRLLTISSILLIDQTLLYSFRLNIIKLHTFYFLFVIVFFKCVSWVYYFIET